MVVADDLRPQQGTAGRRPSKRLVPAPHKAAAKVAAQPGAASPPPPKLNGSSAPAGGALAPPNGSSSGNGRDVAPPTAVQQLVARQGLIKAASAELSLAQRQVQEQQLELKGLRGQLA